METAKSDPKTAIQEALLDPETLEALAICSQASCGELDGRLMEMQAAGATIKDVEVLKRAVRQKKKELIAARKTDVFAANQDSIHYENTPDGIIWNRATDDEIFPQKLTNFSAEIVEEVHYSDGVEIKKFFRSRSGGTVSDRSLRSPPLNSPR